MASAHSKEVRTLLVFIKYSFLPGTKDVIVGLSGDCQIIFRCNCLFVMDLQHDCVNSLLPDVPWMLGHVKY